MFNQIFIDSILLVAIFVISIVCRKYLLGAGFSFLLVSFEIVADQKGFSFILFKFLAIVLISILIVADGKKNGKESLLYRHNPYNAQCLLPRWLRIALLVVLSVAFTARAYLSMRGFL